VLDISIFVQHPLYGVELADDLANPNNRGPALRFRMVMRFFRRGGSTASAKGT
jgi:hypothetical protein